MEEEFCIKLDIPTEFKREFELALAKVLKQVVRKVEFSIANEMLSKSKLTDEQISELSREVKKKVAKQHGL